MSKTLVIVESPAKARTISRFLGKDYEVKASFGHIRDLPEKATDVPAEMKQHKWAKLGVNVEKDFEPLYVVPADKKRHVTELRAAAKDARKLMLATDEDREGESISWHILNVLKPKKGVEIERIVFHEITPEAIDAAIKNPRQIDESLVRAQETRRILDRLYGYTLSPLLWKKVAPRLSAGRVQSVAVRLVVMRERERRDFVSAQFSSITAVLQADAPFRARLFQIDQQAVADGGSFDARGQLTKSGEFWLKSEEAVPLADRLKGARPWTVDSVDRKPGAENPPPPFMTSTLQQEANRKFGFTARRTMQVAQALYEGIDAGQGSVGLITYMRTDSLTLADRALQEAKAEISKRFGSEYSHTRQYKSKSKSAQEAHEAIRPTSLSRDPESVRRYLTDEQFKLYDLIWKRTLASQMASAKVTRTRVVVSVNESQQTYRFSASGKEINFPGFLRIYVVGSDDPDSDLGDKEIILPSLQQGQTVEPKSVEAGEHETKPPARYTEASLVQKLEAEGIGRPSTYASIIGTIQDRGYVFKQGNALVPTFTAFAVTELLEGAFPKLVDLKFTAEMENELDEIAEGERSMVDHLHSFYFGGNGDDGILKKVEVRGPEIPFPTIELGEGVVVRIGRNGPFVQRGEGGPGNTASIPEDLAPADLTLEKALELLEQRAKGPEVLGADPNSGRNVVAKVGRYGAYLELEQTEAEVEAKEPPVRFSLPPGVTPEQLVGDDLEAVLSYPKVIGAHPETGEEIKLLLGRFGPYLVSGSQNANLGDTWKTAPAMTVEEAVAKLAEGGSKRNSAGPKVLKAFGKPDGSDTEINLLSGRYGPYVSDGTINATLPRGLDPETVTLEKAVELIKAKAAAGPSKKPRRATARTGAKRTTTKRK